MEYSAYDLYAMQLLHYFVIRCDYQIVRVQQHKDDIWLMNAASQHYPVLRISSNQNTGTLNDEDYIRNVHRMILNLIHREGPIMIINTHPGSASIQNALINQVKVTKEGLSDAKLLHVFPGIDHVIHDVDNQQEEVALLTKEIEEAQIHHKKETIAKAKKKALPKMTIFFMCICTFVFILTGILTFLMRDTVTAMIATGAYYKMSVVANYEYFRLITAGFVHSDIFQLLINLYIFYMIGKSCEPLFNNKQFSLIFLTSIVVGNVFVLVAERNTLSFGITSGVIGIVCAYMVAFIVNGSWHLPMLRISMYKILWLASLMLLVSGVPLIGILGGMVTGILFGVCYLRGNRYKEVVYHIKIAGSIMAILLLILCVRTDQVQPFEKEVDAQLIEAYEHTPMQAYADYMKERFALQYGKE